MMKITPAEMHELVGATADHTWAKFRKQYPKLVAKRPAIKYNARLKVTAGRAFYWLDHIDLSLPLMWEHGQTFLDWTIPHEFGHMVAWRIFEDKDHGEGWHKVMRSIGVQYSRCHPFTNTLHELQKKVKIHL